MKPEYKSYFEVFSISEQMTNELVYEGTDLEEAMDAFERLDTPGHVVATRPISHCILIRNEGESSTRLPPEIIAYMPLGDDGEYLSPTIYVAQGHSDAWDQIHSKEEDA